MSDMSEVMDLIRTITGAGLRFYHRLIRDLTLPNNAGPNEPHLVLGPDLPAQLVAFYSPNTVVASMLAYSNATNYQYTAWVQIAATGEELRASGWVINGSVYESIGEYIDPASGIPRTINFGDFFQSRTDGTSVVVDSPAGTLDPSGTNYSKFELFNVDFLMDSLSQPRGLIARVFSTAATVASCSSTAEVDITALHLAVGAGQLRNQRAYQATLRGYQLMPGSTPAACSYRLRLGSAAGAQIGFFGYHAQQFLPNTTEPLGGLIPILMRNVTGADLGARTLVPTMNLLSGTLTVNLANQTGVGSNSVSLDLIDVGPASRYPDAFALT